MGTLLTGFTFIVIIATMLLLLAGLHAIATYNARRRAKQNLISGTISQTPAGARIIMLPRNMVHTKAKEPVLIDNYVSEEEIV